MNSFWRQFFTDCQFATNCKIICKDGGVKETHKMFLSAISHDVRSYFLTTLDWTEDAVILLPDFSMEEIEEFFKKIFDSELKKCDLFGVLGVFENSSSQNEISPGRPTIKKLVFDETDNQNHEASFSSVEKTVELSIAEIGQNSDFETKKINRKKRKKKVPLTKKVKLGKSVKLAPENVSGESPVFSHPCEHCDRKFKSEDSLFGHVTLKHPEKHEFLQFMVEVMDFCILKLFVHFPFNKIKNWTGC